MTETMASAFDEYVALMKVRMNYIQIVAITAEEDDGGFARLGLLPFSLIDDHDFKFVKGVVEKFEGFPGKAIAGSLNSDDIANMIESFKTLTGKGQTWVERIDPNFPYISFGDIKQDSMSHNITPCISRDLFFVTDHLLHQFLHFSFIGSGRLV